MVRSLGPSIRRVADDFTKELATGPPLDEAAFSRAMNEVGASAVVRSFDLAAGASPAVWAAIEQAIRGVDLTNGATREADLRGLMAGFSMGQLATEYPDLPEGGNGSVTWGEFFMNLSGTWGMMTSLPDTEVGVLAGAVAAGGLGLALGAIAYGGIAGNFAIMATNVALAMGSFLVGLGVSGTAAWSVAILVGMVASALAIAIAIGLSIVVGGALVYFFFNFIGNIMDDTSIAEWFGDLVDTIQENINDALNQMLPGREGRKESRKDKRDKRKAAREAKREERDRDDIFAAPGWPEFASELLQSGFFQNAMAWQAQDVFGMPMFVATWR
jgi:hypothetical protein